MNFESDSKDLVVQLSINGEHSYTKKTHKLSPKTSIVRLSLFIL